jgi:hypothetical protein
MPSRLTQREGTTVNCVKLRTRAAKNGSLTPNTYPRTPVETESDPCGLCWRLDGQFELTAIVEKAELGNPHGVLTMDADGSKWLVEVGQPWRNERAGLTDAMLAKGATLIVVGKRSADKKEQRMKAERIVIGGKNFDLYPERLPARKP